MTAESKVQADVVGLQEVIYQSSNPTRRYLHQQRLAWVRGAIAACGPPAGPDAGSALEIGPGSGIYIPALLAAHRSVTVADVETRHLAHVRGKFGQADNLRIVEDNILDTTFAPAQFDTVLCSEVIEHIAGTAAVLAAIHRLLKPGGRLILTTPQRYSSLELCCALAFLPGIIDVVRWIYREPVLETGHINLMTKPALERALGAAGFAIERSARMGLYIPLLAEFGGHFAARAAARMERRLSASPLAGVLWTQCVIAVRQ